MSRVFNRFTGSRFDNAMVDWLVFATGVLVLAASIAASLAVPAHGDGPGEGPAGAARTEAQAEVTPG